jgi:hypothetical protein
LTLERHRFYVRVMPSDADRAWQHPWLRISLLLRTMLHTRWSAEAWAEVRVEFRKALALRSPIRRAGWFIHENALPVNGLLSPLDNEQSPAVALNAPLDGGVYCVAWNPTAI